MPECAIAALRNDPLGLLNKAKPQQAAFILRGPEAVVVRSNVHSSCGQWRACLEATESGEGRRARQMQALQLLPIVGMRYNYPRV